MLGRHGRAPGATHRPSYGLTVADVVPRGCVVGVDESHLVYTLLAAVVAARPALIGTTSLAAVSTLAATRQALRREFVVRLFGGELRPAAGAFTGPRGVQAVTDTACDVALVAGRLVDGIVWVPADVRSERLALVLAAQRSYLVLTHADAPTGAADPADQGSLDGPRGPGDVDEVADPDGSATATRPWARLAPLTAFDGVLEVAPQDGPGQDGPGERRWHAA